MIFGVLLSQRENRCRAGGGLTMTWSVGLGGEGRWFFSQEGCQIWGEIFLWAVSQVRSGSNWPSSTAARACARRAWHPRSAQFKSVAWQLSVAGAVCSLRQGMNSSMAQQGHLHVWLVLVPRAAQKSYRQQQVFSILSRSFALRFGGHSAATAERDPT